jgi:hypothetical protein
MSIVPGPIRYAVRQFRLSPVFTAAAVLTLALGIGGTTAIFTLIDAIMLRSLPVTDPARLYRIGDGADCCVEGGPQGHWGLFSFPLFERLKAAAPEFEEVTAFQAGAARVSARREGVDSARGPTGRSTSPATTSRRWVSGRSAAGSSPPRTIALQRHLSWS